MNSGRKTGGRTDPCRLSGLLEPSGQADGYRRRLPCCYVFQEQISPMIGLLGTIAGYLLGKTETEK